MCREKENQMLCMPRWATFCEHWSWFYELSIFDTEYGSAGIQLNSDSCISFEGKLWPQSCFIPVMHVVELILLHLSAVMHVKEFIPELWHSSAICTERMQIKHCACKDKPHCAIIIITFNRFFFLQTLIF